MNKIERKRVKRAKTKLNQRIVTLEQQLAITERAMTRQATARRYAEQELEYWRQKLQAIYRHSAVLPPEHNPRYAGPRYVELTNPVWEDDLAVRSLSHRVLTMAELYLEMSRDVARYQRYFHFTAIPPNGGAKRMAYCVSEHMWRLMREQPAEFEQEVVRTMYRKIMQLKD